MDRRFIDRQFVSHYNRGLRQPSCPLVQRLGHLPLEQAIGVRIPGGQPTSWLVFTLPALFPFKNKVRDNSWFQLVSQARRPHCRRQPKRATSANPGLIDRRSSTTTPSPSTRAKSGSSPPMLYRLPSATAESLSRTMTPRRSATLCTSILSGKSRHGDVGVGTGTISEIAC